LRNFEHSLGFVTKEVLLENKAAAYLFLFSREDDVDDVELSWVGQCW
jgi:hypothetical protein